MTPDPCESCDFIGPLWPVTQQSTDLHRAWHDLQRTWQRAVAPIIAAFHAARESTQAMYTLIPHLPETDQEDELMNRKRIDPAKLQPGDTITARGTHGAVVGARVEQYHAEWSTMTDGTPVRALRIHPDIVLLLDGADPWTVTELAPMMPELVEGVRYQVTTDRDETVYATWAPVDGIRANHPWLDATDGNTRYRRDYIIRAIAAPSEIAAPAEDNIL